MKKLFICLLALTLAGFVACKKDEPDNTTTQQEEPQNPAKDFEGNYTVTTLAHLQVPVLGDTDMPLSDMEAVIALQGNNGEVTVTMADQTTTGYVNAAGLHVDPLMLNETLYGMQVSMTVTFPVISKPVDGVTSWVATVSATTSYGAITGTADMTAVKHEL